MYSDIDSDPKRDLLERARGLFRQRFGAAPAALAFAPGRVEVLGNHTDYNGGFILSVALGHGVAAAAGPIAGSEVHVFSEALDAAARFSIERLERTGAWVDYVQGVIAELFDLGAPLGGMRIALAADLPLGSGVSSSAALEVATAEAALALAGDGPRDPMELARLCQRAEVDFVGMPCGLLDQFSAVFGIADGFLFLDCATLEHRTVAVAGTDIRVVVADSGVRHELVDGKYAELRRSCERAAARLGAVVGHPVRFLRDVGVDEFERHAAAVAVEDRPRAEHVVRENDRVLRGLHAIEEGDLARLGALMLESHASSRDLLGNSCAELDLLVAAAERLPGLIGAKLSGGGFGGATVNLVEAARLAEFRRDLAAAYRTDTGREPFVLESAIGAGARGYRLK